MGAAPTNPLPNPPVPRPDSQVFRKVRLDSRDYLWLQLASIKSVGKLDGQVVIETDTQTYALDPESDRQTRSPEQILADALGEGKLSECVPYLRSQIWDLIDRKKVEEQAVHRLQEMRAELAADIKRLRAERARAGLSIADAGQAGILSIFGGKKAT